MFQEESAVQVPLHPAPADPLYAAAQRDFFIAVLYVVVLGCPYGPCVCGDHISSALAAFAFQYRKEHGRCPVPYGGTETLLLFKLPDCLLRSVFFYGDGSLFLTLHGLFALAFLPSSAGL